MRRNQRTILVVDAIADARPLRFSGKFRQPVATRVRLPALETLLPAHTQFAGALEGKPGIDAATQRLREPLGHAGLIGVDIDRHPVEVEVRRNKQASRRNPAIVLRTHRRLEARAHTRTKLRTESAEVL